MSADASTAEVFWSRGITPAAWTTYGLPDPPAVSHSNGMPPNGRLQVPSGAQAGTDGSGGSNGSDPRLRRCGWSWCIILDKKVVASRSGPVSGKQTVPRAEITAIADFLEHTHTQGATTIHVDCKPALDKVLQLQKGQWKPDCHTVNGDLWLKVHDQISRRRGALTFKQN